MRVGVPVADKFVTTRHARRDQLRAMVVERGIDERARRHFQLIEQFDTAPCAHAVAVLAPAMVQHIRLRRNRAERGAESLAECKVLDIEAEIDRKPAIAGPAERVAVRDRAIRKAAMGGDRLTGAILCCGHVPCVVHVKKP